MARDIQDVLNFRQDLSPFLAHLTRNWPLSNGKVRSAKAQLQKIIEGGKLRAGPGPISDARWGAEQMFVDEARRFFGAISFTETPIGEIHCLLEIEGRAINLEPYGLVFLRDALSARGVSPVFYINNEPGAQDDVIRAMCTLIDTAPDAAEKVLPMVSFYGNKFTPFPKKAGTTKGEVNFRWEREWRYPAALGALTFDEDDVFVGLCPHEEIEEFEELFEGVRFIDPRRNMKWYAEALIDARQRHDLKVSVV